MYLSKTKLLTLSLSDFLKCRKKYFFFFFILILISSCNYKPLFNENRLSNLTFRSIETSGDKRIAQIMVNKLNIIKKQNGKNTLYATKFSTGLKAPSLFYYKHKNEYTMISSEKLNKDKWYNIKNNSLIKASANKVEIEKI